MAEAPDSFQATLNLTPGERGVFVSLCHAGDAAEAERLLRSFRTVATPAKDTVRRQEFAELAGRSPAGAPDASFRCVASIYRNELSDEVMDIILDRLSEAPADDRARDQPLHARRGLPGQRRTQRPSRFANREGVHIRVTLEWKDSAAAARLMPWADEACRLLRPSSGERIYANYQSDEGKGSAQAVFGSNHSRLVALKNKYDPTNLFRRNSNVEPRKA